jgi:hypothetical protein
MRSHVALHKAMFVGSYHTAHAFPHASLMLLLMSMVALWSATHSAMPKVRGSKLGRTNSIFVKLNLKSFRS